MIEFDGEMSVEEIEAMSQARAEYSTSARAARAYAVYAARASALRAQQKETMLSNSVPVLQEQVRSLQQRVIELEGNVSYEEV